MSLSSNFTVEFVDSNQARLDGITSEFGIMVGTSIIFGAAKVGNANGPVIFELGRESTPKLVTGAATTFVSLTVQNLAGRLMSLRFQELSSSLQAQTHTFTIYPFALKLVSEPPVASIAGQSIPISVEMHDSRGQVLISL